MSDCTCPDTWDCPFCKYDCEVCTDPEVRRLYGVEEEEPKKENDKAHT